MGINGVSARSEEERTESAWDGIVKMTYVTGRIGMLQNLSRCE